MQSISISNLPEPVAGYFARQATEPLTLAQCFTEDALVVDEDREHRGRAAITAWQASLATKFAFTTEVLSAESASTEVNTSEVTVRARVTGNFPGGTVDLRFLFALDGGLITRLEIAP